MYRPTHDRYLRQTPVHVPTYVRHASPAYSTHTEQWHPHLDAFTGAHTGAPLESLRRDDDDRGAVVEVAELLTLPEARTAQQPTRATVVHRQRDVHEVQVDAGHENRRHSHEH